MSSRPPKHSRPPKQEKREINYSWGTPERHCGKLANSDEGYCRCFVAHRNDVPDATGLCKQVKGEITRTYSCNLYSAAFPSPTNLPRRQRTKADGGHAEY
jgi:hypothetical protein